MRPAGIPKTSDICVSLGLSQTSYYALPSFGKGISWLNYIVRLRLATQLHRRTRFGL